MQILFTGGSSFTGYWFIKALAEEGHAVTAIFQRPLEEYTGIRKQRVEQLLPFCTPVFDVSFGSDAFLNLIRSQSDWDLLCHHAADVTDYKSDLFDPIKALDNNTFNLVKVLKCLKEQGCDKVLLTGSVFEQNEGEGSEPLVAFSPYGLSKGLTSDVFKYYAAFHDVTLGKFVIPNPFGPYEEARFTSYLVETWLQGQPIYVRTPLYVRDNIPSSLLAKVYCQFAEDLMECHSREFLTFHPSCYAESQSNFAARCATAMRPRLDRPCVVIIEEQANFKEPLKRVNSNQIDWKKVQWNESAAWDEFAEYYINRQAIKI